jgi:hypothetical protein
MAKFEEKLNELGGFEKLPKSLKRLVKDYEDAEKGLEELKSQVESAPEEEVEKIQEDIQDTAQLLEDSDDEITKKIVSYIKNKDGYEERMKVMREKKNASLIAQGKPPLQEKKVAAPAPAPTPAPVAVADTKSIEGQGIITKSGGGETQVITPEVVEEKEESGIGSWLFFGALGFAGILLGINLFKNRN